MHIDRLIDGVVLQRPDHLEAGAIANVCQPRIFVATEVALQDAAVGSSIEHGSPGLQLTHAIGRFLRVQLGHPPVIEILAATHRVGEMDFPVVAIVHIGKRRGDTSFRHHRVRLPKK